MHPIDRVLGQAVAHVEFAPRRAVGMEDALGGGEPDATLRIALGVIDPKVLQARHVARPGDELFSVKAPRAVHGGGEQRAVRQRQQSTHGCAGGPAGSPFASVNSVHVPGPLCADGGS